MQRSRRTGQPGAVRSTSLPEDTEADLVRLAEVLDRHGVEYLVVGGVAARAHGASRPTQDLGTDAGDLGTDAGDLDLLSDIPDRQRTRQKYEDLRGRAGRRTEKHSPSSRSSHVETAQTLESGPVSSVPPVMAPPQRSSHRDYVTAARCDHRPATPSPGAPGDSGPSASFSPLRLEGSSWPPADPVWVQV